LVVIFIAAAICLSCRPWAANKTIRARATTRSGSDRLRAHCSKAAYWSKLNAMARAIRIHEVSCSLDESGSIMVVTYDAPTLDRYHPGCLLLVQIARAFSSPYNDLHLLS
jgi:hypothetical protein